MPGGDEQGAQVVDREDLRLGVEGVVGQVEPALGDVGQQAQTRQVPPVAQQGAGPLKVGQRVADGFQLRPDHPVRPGESGADLLGGLAGEAAWPTVVRGAPAESVLAAGGAVDHRRLVAGRAGIRAGGGGFQCDPFEPSADAAGPTRVPVAANAEIPRSIGLPASSGGEWADSAASLASIVTGAVSGVAGGADSAAVAGACVDPPLPAAAGAGLLG